MLDSIRKILMVIILTSLFGCNSSDWKYFSSERFKFGISYPGSWMKMEKDYLGREFFVKDFRNDGYPIDTNFEILVKDFSFNDLDEHQKYYIDFVEKRSVFSDVIFLSVEEKEFKGVLSREYVIAAAMDGCEIKWKTIFFVQEKMLYQLTTTSSQKEFNEYESITNRIFNSFEWK